MSFETEFAKGNTGTPFYHVAKYWYELGEKAAAKEALQLCEQTKDLPDSFGEIDRLSSYGNAAVDSCIDAIKEKFGLEI